MIIITGASRGIGKQLFDKFSKMEDVVGTSLNGHEGLYQVDISDKAEVDDFFNNICTEHKGKMLNLTLINCAGITDSERMINSKREDWDRVVEVNLLGTANVIHSALAFMIPQRFGRIINMGSVVAQSGMIGTTAYAASKAGLWGLSKSLSKEVGKYNITVNTMNLGYTDMGMIEQVPEKVRERLNGATATGRLGNIDDVLESVQYLRRCSFITGTELNLNGGIF